MKFDRTVLIVIAVTFLVGVIAGFGLWGIKKEEKIDVKQLLTTVVEEIGKIEQENKELRGELEATIDDRETVAVLKQENRVLQGQLMKAEQYSQQLQDETAGIRAALAEAESKAQTADNFQAMAENLQKRVFELEQENQNLNKAIKKISSITQGQDEPMYHKGTGQAKPVAPEEPVSPPEQSEQ
ncbi:MAG TPA: hypothetical protein ENH40_00750 [Nitrospirae bacterium]|nr:hypothetical protein [Nitrospirota bacterium]